MKCDKEYLEDVYKRHKEVIASKPKDEFYGIKFKEKKWKPLKMVATFILTIGITIGIVYATNINMRNENKESKIWKEPKVYNFDEIHEITEEEKARCISEEEARKLAHEALKKIGLEGETIQNIKLEKGFFSNENEWQLASNKATITLDGETGNLKTIQVPTWNYHIPYNYGITREEAKETAYQLLEKCRPEEDKDEYELVKLTRNMETDEASYIWYAQFYKKYGDLLNPYEEIYIGWVPTINGIYSLNITRGKYEKNPIEISKEKAIEIAKKKHEQIQTNTTIENLEAEIRIKQMNEDVYLRENHKEEYEDFKFWGYATTQYITEKRVRKVWCVVIDYEENESEKEEKVQIEDNKVIKKYTYFVDCTTGEIIGGNSWSVFDMEKTIEEDFYNFAK